MLEKSQNTTSIFKGFSFRYLLSILIGYIGLTLSPAIYLALWGGNGWWPLFASIAVAIEQLAFIALISAFQADEIVSFKDKESPLTAGLFSGLLICNIIFWIVFTFLISETSLLNKTLLYYGFLSHGESPELITYIFWLIAAFVCVVVVNLLLGNVSGYDKGVPFLIFKNKPFTCGFCFTITLFLLIGIILWIPPICSQNKYNQKIKERNEKIDSINDVRMRLSEKRSQEYRTLSFSDFILGSDIDSCKNVINSTYGYSIISKENASTDIPPSSLCIKGVDYSDVVDSIVYVAAEWDNTPITIGLFTNNRRVLGIMFETKNSLDSITSIYIKKYGEPENLLAREKETDGYLSDFEIYHHDFEKQVRDDTGDTICWTFKNAIISISTIDYLKTRVLYFDRRCELIYKQIKEYNNRIQKMRQDSILREQEYKKKKKESEEREKQNKHKESIEKI